MEIIGHSSIKHPCHNFRFYKYKNSECGCVGKVQWPGVGLLANGIRGLYPTGRRVLPTQTFGPEIAVASSDVQWDCEYIVLHFYQGFIVWRHPWEHYFVTCQTNFSTVTLSHREWMVSVLKQSGIWVEVSKTFLMSASSTFLYNVLGHFTPSVKDSTFHITKLEACWIVTFTNYHIDVM